ncbi:MAG: hypothetical protein RMK29_13600 [Myxococcales bacterium]|nr:RNA-binding protein [Myxococcota bacterium]MDW8282743.1 hypothetical protein [Myxococcales bacterium]
MGTKLFVGNLSYSVTEQELRDAFSQSGRTVQTVRIALDRETQRPRGFAFVEVATDADADSAINEWNNKMLSGRTIFVERAQERPPGAPRPAPRNRPAPEAPPPRSSAGSPRSFMPMASAEPQREQGRRHNSKPERKREKRGSGRPEERERGKWRWDGSDDY